MKNFKQILDQWQIFLKEEIHKEFLSRKINEITSNKRFVNDQLIEIDKKDPRWKFPLSEKEYNRIKEAAGIEGVPEFLGAGSKGTAWKIGDKVLKITNDTAEANATNLLVGKDHPNLYKIDLVAKRSPEDRKETLSHMPYVIVYEFLEYPTNNMVDVTNNLFHKIKENKLYYNWQEDYLERGQDLLRQVIVFIDENPEVLKSFKKGKSLFPVLEEIANEMNLSSTEKEILKIFWTFEKGAYNNSLESPLKALQHEQEILSNPTLRYLSQAANALSWLKKQGVIFSDLKTSNVMQKDNQLAFIDIGYSKVLNKKPIGEIDAIIKG